MESMEQTYPCIVEKHTVRHRIISLIEQI